VYNNCVHSVYYTDWFLGKASIVVLSYSCNNPKKMRETPLEHDAIMGDNLHLQGSTKLQHRRLSTILCTLGYEIH
jgi:hypothetical protein